MGYESILLATSRHALFCMSFSNFLFREMPNASWLLVLPSNIYTADVNI